MITRADFDSLTKDLQDIFNETASDKVAESQGLVIYNAKDTMMRIYQHLILHGVGGIKRVTPGQDLPLINTEQGDHVSWTQEYFGAIAAVTKDMRKFDLYDEIEGVVRTLTEDAFDKIDQSMADKVGHGWSTSAYTDVYGGSSTTVGPDSAALFAATHSNPINSNTYSNIITDGTNTNPALSRAAIVHMRAVGLTMKDPNNLTRSVTYDTLIVPAALEDLAERLVYSDKIPGSVNNDVNPLKGKIKRIIVWPRLDTLSDSTDCSAYWLLADWKGLKETLQCRFAERPTLDPPEQVYENKNWEYSCDFYYTLGIGLEKYLAGSKGDNS